MSLLRQAKISCDNCGAVLVLKVFHLVQPDSVRTKIRRQGWTRPDGRDVCPRCTATAGLLARPHMEI